MNIDLWIYLFMYLAVISWTVSFTCTGERWWDSVEKYAPSWGNSEFLIGGLYLTWITSTFYLIYRQANKGSARFLNYTLLTSIAIITLVEAYAVSESREKYSDAYYASLIALAVNFVILYLVIKDKKDKFAIWLSALAFIISVFMTVWFGQVKINAGN